MIVFSTPDYEYLKKELLQLKTNWVDGVLTRKQFPDGERYLKIDTEVKDQDVLILGGTQSDANTLEIFDLGCAVSKYGANSINFVVPYFGYSTMERTVNRGEVVGAKTRARLLSAIPQSTKGNQVLLIDLHSEGIPYYFEGHIKVFHLYAKKIILKMVKDIAGKDEIVLGSTDAGRAKWVESLANEYGCMPAFVYKQRLSGSQTKVTGVNADVKDKHVIIYDDMIRTGGSIIQAAESYLKAGASKVSAITTHAVLPTVNGVSSIDKMINSGLFSHIGMTNTHPVSQNVPTSNYVKVYSVAELIVDFIKD